MSKIDDLVARLCPDGVKYKALGEIGTLTRGKRFVRADMKAMGCPCIHYGEMYTHYGVWANEAASFLDVSLSERLRHAHKGDVVIVGAGETVEDIGIGVAWLGDMEVAVHDACYIFSHDLNPKYVSYFLRTTNYHAQIKKFISSSKISSISASNLAKVKMPVPPMEVQEEIVRVLDAFADLESKLEAELQAELEARRKQYRHYRDKLLDFGDGGGGVLDDPQ